MTMHCFQTLVISGEKGDLAPFTNKLLASWHNCEDNPSEGRYELLQTFYPMPDDIYCGPSTYDDLETYVLQGWKADDIHEYVAAWTKEQLEKAKEKYGKGGWHWLGWREEHWGSKWADLFTTVDEIDDTYVKISFASAWGPLLPAILHISNDYPLLTFSVEYQDEGYNYPDSGAKMKGGKILSEWQESEEEFEKRVYGSYADS
jgi:hypothetical protein